VCRGADVVQLHQQVVDVHVQPVLEGHERRRQAQLAPLDRVEHAVEAADPGGEHALPAAPVTDDGGLGQQAVAVRVVAVVVGVDQGAHRLDGHVADRAQQRPRPALGGAGVDGHDALRADQEAGVVDPPAAVGLHVGEHVVGHLHGVRGREPRVVGVAGGGGSAHAPTLRPPGTRVLAQQ
jgi:hypothetical protein